METKKISEIIAQFKRETGYELEVKNGKPFYSGSLDLDLRGTGITSLPEGLTVGGDLDLDGCTGITSLPEWLTVGGDLDLDGCTGITSLPEGLTVGGSLDLRGTGITSLPEGLTVGGSLDLRGTGITSLPEWLTVGGWLDLRGTGITSLPEWLTVGGWLNLRGTGITSLPEGLTVGGDLNLRGTGITSLPEGLTVGGWLDLDGCTGITSLPEGLTVGGSLNLDGCTGITSLPEGLTVGGDLNLRGTGITSLPEGLTVGGDLNLDGCTGITDTSEVSHQRSDYARKRINTVKQATACLQWERNGKRYIKVDGIFSGVDAHRGNVWKVHTIGSTKVMHIVTDGEGHYAHGDSLAEAKEDLIYKIADRDTSAYKSMSLDDELSYAEAIAAYRTITGACSAGTRDYTENRLPQPHKERYSIREIIALTKGEYGGEKFAQFFEKICSV